MLTNLHVKNLALIDELEVEFKEGLNILTGETGAGKSIIIGSINLALGAKMSKEMIRENAPYALVELVFQIKNHKIQEILKTYDIHLEEEQLIITRKIMEGRSISKINGETCTISQIKEVSSLLLDIHGQNQHQSLLYHHKQLEILDDFGKDEIADLKKQVAKAYKNYQEKKKAYDVFALDEQERLKEINFLEYECNEIEEACLQEGEDEELETQYRRLVHGKNIVENMNEVHSNVGYDSGNGAGDLVGRSLKALQEVSEYDDELANMESMLMDIDALLNDFNREVSSYLSDASFSEEDFVQIENRLNNINTLKAKYGQSIESIFKYQKTQRKKLEQLYDYEINKERARKEVEEAKKTVDKKSSQLSVLRKNVGKELEKSIKEQLKDLNFLNIEFEISFTKMKNYSANGFDQVEYIISTNPGEIMKPLDKVVSGGELSRIMLAIKTLLAQKDDTDTLIFDEIDTGISGRTAQMVSEKMAVVSQNHQVICITHLAQIAAMSDAHFEIIKNVEEMETHTRIHELNKEQSIKEIARILGGAKITESIIKSAKEMKDLAYVQKNTRVK